MLDMKVEKKTISLLYSWLPTGTYHKKLAIWYFFSFEIWRTWAKFSMKNPLVRSKSYFPGQNLAKFSDKQITVWKML
jgi:hypothetical protein